MIKISTDFLCWLCQAQLLSWGFAEESGEEKEKRGLVIANGGHEGHFSCFLVPFVCEQYNITSWEFLRTKNKLSIMQPPKPTPKI